MVTTKLQGGLGNQMFQIAVAYAYGKEHDIPAKFKSETIVSKIIEHYKSIIE